MNTSHLSPNRQTSHPTTPSSVLPQRPDWRGCRILITGASGFIGSFLVERALQEGMEVWAAVRKSSSRAYLQDHRIHFIELDFSSDDRMLQQLEAHRESHGPWTYVVHAAGATKCRDEKDFAKINTEGTLRFARLLKSSATLLGRFVFISSLSVMGAIREKKAAEPTPGWRYAPIRNGDQPLPNTAYGRSKLEAEKGLAYIKGLDYVVLRPTGVYGPREKDYFMMAQSIVQHIDFAVGYRQQEITFIYVKDLVEAAFLALYRGGTGQTYFLTDGDIYHSRTFSDLLQQELKVKRVFHIKAPLWILRVVCALGNMMGRMTGKAITLNNDKYHILRQRNWQCDLEPARRELGYHPQYPLERGVKEAVAWYKKEKWL
ncbi:NAD dependent epimerase/reductase-like protein [gut metagenome]|uniref:NAD dependent epimerase/reductase-like protein n=1 Tax=gut metagenome TaxID=749906 RepID=J9G2L7_9ZZZZ